MMTTLRVLVGENWPEPAEATWVVLDNSGEIVNRGVSDPRSWPVTDRTELVLGDAQASWMKVRLPKAGVREQAQSLSYALEEHIVGEADSQHATPTVQEPESWSIIIVARERLKRLVNQFNVINRPLDGVYSILQSVPCSEGEWSIAVASDFTLIRAGQQSAWFDDLHAEANTPPLLLEASLAEAKRNSALPTRLAVYSGESSIAPAWLSEVGTHTDAAGSWHWYGLTPDCVNLLHGEFSPSHKRQAWQRALKPAGIAASLLLLAHLLFGTAYALYRRSELSQLNQTMVQVMQSQLPSVPVLDPEAQIKRELNLQRAQKGLLADDAALSLLADFSSALGTDAQNAVKQLRYQDGVLDITLNQGFSLNEKALTSRLTSRGLTATARENSQQYMIRRKP